MCRACKQYGEKFIITAPITPTEKKVWDKYGYEIFMFWHRWFVWDWEAKDAKGIRKMA